ncbi:MAG: hypothetical protein CMG74_04720 [Candidatus Marinimicrobia bacterium]|nr:hypothetical protein [Candidatus Neomarinimicrobiota bacterium]|tara:strand:+ start:6576 stop:7583 length:1008 start_codon:yes stop_codon:yes gene_type:complete
MNVVIVGLGSIGEYYLEIIPKIVKKSNILVIEKAKLKKSKRYTQTSFNEILKKKINIDYAIICTPSGLHFKHASFFLKKKCDVLIEKPFVLKLNHANELISIANKNNLKCWTTLQNRYNLATKKLKKEINKKTIGKVNLVDCVLFWNREATYYKNSGWRGKFSLDGGVLTNQAIHLLDMLIYVFGPIKYFDAMASYNKSKLEAEDLIIINFKHKNGILSSFKATTRANRNYRTAIDVIGSKGRYIVKGIALNTFNIFTKNYIFEDKKNSQKFNDGKGFGHLEVLREFLSSKKKSSQNLEISKNIYVLEVIHSIYNLIKNRKKYNKIKNINSPLGK